jgi:hypothetical protein
MRRDATIGCRARGFSQLPDGGVVRGDGPDIADGWRYRSVDR